MGIHKPFHRNIRSHVQSAHSSYSSWAYIRDPEYSTNATSYLRAYFIIQSDFEKLCEYVEPSPESQKTYSHRIHELLMRTCIEVEANFKAILGENKSSVQKPNMAVYRKIDVTHHLSSYNVSLPIWRGPPTLITPFKNWAGSGGFGKGKSPDWYTAYNDSKHDRQESFKLANMEQLLQALAGLLVVLSSQFRTQDFSAAADGLSIGFSSYHSLEPALGNLFRIGFPDDWEDSEKYDFNWQELCREQTRFSKINYDAIVVS